MGQSGLANLVLMPILKLASLTHSFFRDAYGVDWNEIAQPVNSLLSVAWFVVAGVEAPFSKMLSLKNE